jgi:hypothetical protein
MSKVKKVASVAFVGATAVAGGVYGTPAYAAGSWKVSNSGTPYTAGHFSALNLSTSATLVAGSVTLTCAPGTAFASGSAKSASPNTPASLGTINTATFGASGGCLFLGLPFSAHLTSPATLVASSYDSGSGVTHGMIKNIHAVIHGTGALACDATVTGSLPATFTNSTHILAADPATSHPKTLTVHSPVGCLNRLHDGQSAAFIADYNTISPPSLTITGP